MGLHCQDALVCPQRRSAPCPPRRRAQTSGAAGTPARPGRRGVLPVRTAPNRQCSHSGPCPVRPGLMVRKDLGFESDRDTLIRCAPRWRLCARFRGTLSSASLGSTGPAGGAGPPRGGRNRAYTRSFVAPAVSRGVAPSPHCQWSSRRRRRVPTLRGWWWGGSGDGVVGGWVGGGVCFDKLRPDARSNGGAATVLRAPPSPPHRRPRTGTLVPAPHTTWRRPRTCPADARRAAPSRTATA